MIKATLDPRPVAAATSVFINEIHYDNTGTDAGEAIEVAGPAGTNLAGWSIVLYNGTGGASYDTDMLSGTIPNQGGGFGTVVINYPSNGIQNGSPDGIALVNASNVVVQFLSYEGTFTAVGGPAAGMMSTDIGVSENGSEPLGQSLRLSGTGQMYEDFTWNAPATSSFGAINTDQTFTNVVTCSTPVVFINEIHYDNTGTDAGEAIEVAGPAGTNLAGWSIVLYNGTGGASYDTDMLSGTIPNQGGGFGTVVINYPSNGIQNGSPDGIALVNASNVVVQFLSYEGTFTAVGGPAAGMMSTDIGVSENGSEPLGQSLRLSGTGCCYGDFTWNAAATSSFGAINTGQTFSCGGGVFLSIDDVMANEGDSGTTTFMFTVSLSQSAPANVTFDIATQDDSATVADNDYVANSIMGQTIPMGSQTFTFSVTVNGDMTVEPNQTFFVNVTNVSGATILDGQGVGTIINDDVTTTPIHTIQGSGAASPFVGQTVTTTINVVTAKKTNGFFIQTPTGNEDNDPNTSEGVFVFTSSAPTVAVGDNVRVTGTVVEFFQLTEINTTPANIVLFSSGNSLPAPVAITTTILDANDTLAQVNARLETLESMRVSASSLTSVSPTNEFGEFYTVITGVARPFREPGVASSDTLPPGVPCCVPVFDENPERFVVDSDGVAGVPRLNVTSNVTVTNVTGPLDFTFDEYKLLPESTPTATANMTAVPVPEPCAGEFTVASFNMERFYDTVNDPGTSDDVLSLATFNTRLNKASLAIRNVMQSPDIIGVEEVENLTTLQAIAAKLNADAVADGDPNPNYQAFLEEGNDIGGINVGFLVKTSRVTVIDVVQEGKDTTFTFNSTTAILNDRPPLILRAVVTSAVGTPFPVTVIVNHLRSLIGIEDATDGPRVRAKRSAQAEFLGNLIQTRQVNDANERIISVGDYNAFEFSDGYVDVMGAIKGMPAPFDEVVLANSDVVTPDLINLTEGVPAAERYSFVFQGSAQVLDHILMTQNLQTAFSRIHYARNDADFPESLRGDATRSERISDHDMPVAYFRFPMIVNVSVSKTSLWPANHKMVNVTVNYDLNACGATTCTLTVTSNEPIDGEDDGNTSPDWEVLDPHNVRLRAERSGVGTGRVYTITITCTDSTGHTESRTVTVTVPLNQT